MSVLPDETATPRTQEPILLLLRDMVNERTGIFFDSDRLDLMLDKLADRLTATSSRTYLDYYYLLKYDDTEGEEWKRVMDAFSVQETYFWREADQINALVQHLVPAWFRSTQEPLRILSAACATGEEPYSVAMALHEAGWGRHPISIHGIDASESALTKARAGFFRERSFRALSPELRARYFQAKGDGSVLDPEIVSRVTFEWANLADIEIYRTMPVMPVVFCRNVFIYFSPAVITRVVNALAERMPVGGHLFIGSSESLLKLTNRFDLHEVGKAFVYVRQNFTR